MKGENGLRSRLGLSQEWMAGYLGISRSTLNMSERYERSLSTAALIKQGPLERALHSNEQPATMQKIAIEETGILKKEMEKCIDNCNYKLANARFRLKKMLPDYEKARNALKVAGVMLAKLPNTEQAKKDRIWLQLLEAEAWQRITKCGKAAQTKLQLQIDVLEFELAAAQAKLNQ